MPNIWFTSDTHFGHGNIAGKNSSKWKDGYRHYNSTYEMNADIVKSFNKVVKEDDILYHLEDFSFGGIDNIWNFRKQLLCKNIHLILGNHDHHIEDNKQLPNCRSDYSSIDSNGNFILLDNPYIFNSNPTHIATYAKDLFSSVSHTKTIKTPNNTIFMSHYAHRVWYGSHKGIIHLYGHSHGSLEKESWGKSMDVGIDVAISRFGVPRPFHLEEIKEIMSKRQVKFVDNHDASTNI